MINAPINKQHQCGAVTLITALVVLVMLSLLALVGSRVGLVQQRVTTNNAEAVKANTVARSGLQAAMTYLVANRSELTSTTKGGWKNYSGPNNGTSPNWQKCTATDTQRPCGNGETNVYGPKWQYFAVPSSDLPSLPSNSNYDYEAWYLSKLIDKTPAPTSVSGKCTTLLPSGSGLFGLLGDVTDGVLGAVNGVLGGLTHILNPLLEPLTGGNGLLPAIGIPPDLCLPINIEEVPPVPPPSEVNPTIHVLVQAKSNFASGGSAVAQIALQPTSALQHLPIAAIMASNDVMLIGDVRVWGNPRPPTKTPDFSTINLDALQPLGLPLGDVLKGITAPVGDILDTALGPLLNPITQGLLGTNVSNILDLHLNVTFPLSVWAGGGVALLPKTPNPSQGGSTQPCKWWQVFCHLDNAIHSVFDGLTDLIKSLGLDGLGNLFDNVNNLLNWLEDSVTGLTGGLNATLNSLVGAGNAGSIKLGLVLQSARTCLPPWPGQSSSDKCTPLSQSATVLPGKATRSCSNGSCTNSWKKIKDTLTANVKLPDIQGDGSSSGISTGQLLSTVTDLLKGCSGSNCGPQFPDGESGQPTLLKYVFGTNDVNKIEAASNTSSDCSNFNESTSGLHWISGGCDLDVTVGSPDAPAIIITHGDVTLDAGITVNGIIYMVGGGNVDVDKSDPTSSDRVTIRGALLADGSDGTLHILGPVSIVYDQSIIRKAGFILGGFTTIPGSWKDWSA